MQTSYTTFCKWENVKDLVSNEKTGKMSWPLERMRGSVLRCILKTYQVKQTPNYFSSQEPFDHGVQKIATGSHQPEMVKQNSTLALN